MLQGKFLSCVGITRKAKQQAGVELSEHMEEKRCGSAIHWAAHMYCAGVYVRHGTQNFRKLRWMKLDPCS